MTDNTFATAKYIGSFGSSGGAIFAQGKIGRSDPVDIYKFTVRAGSSFNARSSLSVRGGSLDFSVYVNNPVTNKIMFAGKQTSLPMVNTVTTTFPNAPMPVTLYVKLDRPSRNVKYSFSYTSLFQ